MHAPSVSQARWCSSLRLDLKNFCLSLSLLLSLSLCLSLCGFGHVCASYPVAPAGCSAAAGTCIRIGYYRCEHPSNPSICKIIGQNELADWYIQRVYNRLGGKFKGVPVYFVNVTMTTTAGSVADIPLVNSTFFEDGDITKPKVDFVIGPAGDRLVNAQAELFEPAGIPVIYGSSPVSSFYQCPATMELAANVAGCEGRPNARRFTYAHGLSTPGEGWFQPWVAQLRLQKAKSIGVVEQINPFYTTIREGMELAAADFNIPVTYTASLTVENSTTMREAIEGLIEANPDGVLLSSLNCQPYIDLMYAHDYAPKSLAAVLCVDVEARLRELGDKLNYVCGAAQWSPDMKGNDYLENYDQQPWALFPHHKNGQPLGETSPMQFTALWRNVTNRPDATPGYAEATMLVGLSMLEGAIHLAPTVAPADVQHELMFYYQPSYFGLLSTDRYGMNRQKPMIISQRDSNQLLGIISPTSAASLDFIYPMPKFSERVYVAKILATEIEHAVIGLLVVCSVFTLSLCGYLIKHRRYQIFQAAGLPFYLMMGFGCIVAYSSVLTWGVENNGAMCASRAWVWTLAFHIFLDPVLVTTWRISRIFGQKLRLLRITNARLAAMCGLIFAPQFLINLLWHALAPLQPRIVTVDPLRPGPTSFTTCSGGDDGVMFAAVTLAYSALLLLAACYFAYKVRKAYTMFNDAEPIGASMYIFTVTVAIILVLQTSLDNNSVSAQKVLFALRSIGVLVAYQSGLALLYVRRILGQLDGLSKVTPGFTTNATANKASPSPNDGATSGKQTKATPIPTRQPLRPVPVGAAPASNPYNLTSMAWQVNDVSLATNSPAHPLGVELASIASENDVDHSSYTGDGDDDDQHQHVQLPNTIEEEEIEGVDVPSDADIATMENSALQQLVHRLQQQIETLKGLLSLQGHHATSSSRSGSGVTVPHPSQTTPTTKNNNNHHAVSGTAAHPIHVSRDSIKPNESQHK